MTQCTILRLSAPTSRISHLSMIHHRFILAAMIASMLSCPFLQCSECCGLSTVQVSAECNSCRCCHSERKSSERSPIDQNVPDTHPDCFCHGAVLAVSTDVDVDPTLEVISRFLTDETDSQTTSLIDRKSIRTNSLPLLSGREIYTFLESHLL